MLKKVLNTDKYIYFLIEDDIKMENAPLLYDEFINQNDYKGKKVFFDLLKITFVDSSGIGTLIRCYEYLKNQTSQMILVGVNKPIQTVFRLAGLYQIFEIIDIKDLNQYFTKEQIEIFNKYR